MIRIGARPLGIALVLLFAGAVSAPAGSENTELSDDSPKASPLDGFASAVECLEAGDPRVAAERLAPLAEAGDVRALFALALLHDLGAGVRLDHDRAREMLHRAAAQDFPAAVHYLAWRYKVGFGVDEKDVERERARLTQQAEKVPWTESGVPAAWLELKDGEPMPNFGRAFGWMVGAAGKSDVVAMANLSAVLLGGPWTRANSIGHVSWLRKAAEAGDGPSAERLSLYYRMGLMVSEDQAKSDYWRRQAAEAGVVDAQYALARELARGTERIPEDKKEAATWYGRAAAQGHVDSMLALGRMLRDGEGVAQDYRRACELFQAAADRGDADAFSELGWMIAKGKGTPRDVRKARDAYRKALDLGDDWAGRALGDILQEPEFNPTPWDEVRAAYTLGAERGSEAAMNALGDMYYEGKGCSPDHAEAFSWYERAAREGDAWAQNRVGWMLRRGDGIERDDEEAVSWFRLAAAKGNATAKANLGYHLAHGLGLGRDAAEACRLLVASLETREDRWAASVLRTLIESASPGEAAALRGVLEPILTGERTRDPVLTRIAIFALFEGPEGLRDPAAAQSRLVRLAEAGDVDLMTEACMRSFTGSGMPYDLAEARRWSRLIAEREPGKGDSLEAQIDLAAGDAEARGSARANLEAHAKRGDRHANYILGYMCATGEGMPVDFERAWACIEVLARHGEPKARAALTLRATDSRRGLQTVFGSVAEPLPKADAMAAVVAQRLAAQTQPDSSVAVLHRAAPIFPAILKAAGIEGSATIEFSVGVEGRAESVHCVEATHPLFGVAAEAAVQRWWFVPARVAGEPVRKTVRQRLAFTLSEDEKDSSFENP